jgi:hypothetical protein
VLALRPAVRLPEVPVSRLPYGRLCACLKSLILLALRPALCLPAGPVSCLPYGRLRACLRLLILLALRPALCLPAGPVSGCRGANHDIMAHPPTSAAPCLAYGRLFDNLLSAHLCSQHERGRRREEGEPRVSDCLLLDGCARSASTQLR